MTSLIATLALFLLLALLVQWARGDALRVRPPRREWFD